MIQPKVAVLDIETWPMIVATFGLKDQNIGLNQIRQDWSVMAWGAKQLGAPASTVRYMDTRKQRDMRDDRLILKEMWKILDENDIIITQNGQSFDGPKLNARFMIHKMPPPSPYQHLDTYRIAKRAADFTSNKLEYLTNTLNVKYKKLLHPQFAGMSLWNECEKRNLAAWKEMQTYNIHDVLSTEELYLNLQAWAPKSMPKPHVHVDHKSCKVCGAEDSLRSNGIRLGYRRLACSKCGNWSKEKIK